MFRRNWLMPFAAVCLLTADLCRAQYVPYEVPKEITRILDNYLKDSTAEYGPLFAQEWRFLNKSIQIKDLKVGRPIPEYMLRHTILDTCPDTIPFYKIIEPTGRWFLPIVAHGKPQYELGLMKFMNSWIFFSLGEVTTNDTIGVWGPLLKAYPESTGINPILLLESRTRKYLYFPQIGPRKIYSIRYGYKNDIFPGSIDTLDDSRKLIEYWKKSGNKEIGIENKQFKNNNNTKTGGDK